MGNDEPGLTAREERAAAALAAALHEIAAAEPFRVDRAAFAAAAPRDRVVRSHLPAGLAAALAVVLIASLAVFAAPRLGIGPSAAQSHFDNGQFAFDYPVAWQSLGTEPVSGLPVLGTGSWRLGCPGDPSATDCGEEIMDVTGGRIVVTMWINSGAPASCVKTDTAGTAPLGDAWIRRYNEDSLHATQPTTRWEIRRPGYDFGMNGNLWIQAVTDNQTELANVQAMLATFHWQEAADYCHSPTAAPTLPGRAGHFDNGQFAFDYPAGWRVLAADYLEGMANETVAVLGTGVWRSGCYTTDNGGGCTGDIVDVSGGRVVVKIYERVGGPAPDCQAMTTANATLGPNAVSVTSADGATTWEIPLPGKEFGWPGNIFVEAWSDGQAGQSQAEALVASFGWASGAGAGMCVPADTPAPPTVPS
jgi:hypothetical protein